MAKALAMATLLLVVMALTTMEGVHGFCNMSYDGFKACLPAAAINKPTDNPSADCCAALAEANLSCLCRFKNSGALMKFYQVDPDRAMALPGKCGLALPSNC